MIWRCYLGFVLVFACAITPDSGSAQTASIPARYCNLRSIGLAAYEAKSLARNIQANEEQWRLIEDLKRAEARAREVLSAGCSTEKTSTIQSRLASMQKRAESIAKAIELIKGSFEPFYSSLTDTQKVVLERKRTWRQFWGK